MADLFLDKQLAPEDFLKFMTQQRDIVMADNKKTVTVRINESLNDELHKMIKLTGYTKSYFAEQAIFNYINYVKFKMEKDPNLNFTLD